MNATDSQARPSPPRSSPSGRGATWSHWLHAARPKTLWAAFAPVLIGSAMAYADGAFDAPVALAVLLGAFLIQIGTNFANDYGDFLKGADAHDRQGPLRLTQAGIVSPRTMLLATVLTFAAALGVSLALISRAGWPVLLVGVLSIASGVLYTIGPKPLGYLGLGDLFVLVFFGPVAVGGTYYVQALKCPAPVLVSGLAPGLLAVAILVVNNLRDAPGDAKAGKRTLVVRFGRTFGRVEYLACVLIATLVVPVLLSAWPGVERRGVLLAMAALTALLRPMRIVDTSEVPAALNPVLGATARGLLVYSVLFAIGWTL
ncbi:MAG: 1,4-dihydroxy-2-naphthoate polyprenyltransferase [Lentisphaerae bacterium]|nr:1,4-dihydroxy-2-naphthoate polyprenyltransferase [Lentisphaerota bacterium]